MIFHFWLFLGKKIKFFKKGKKKKIWPILGTICLFLGKLEFCSKSGLLHSYMTLTSFKKTGKTNELIMRKMLRTVGRKDLRADRGKLAEPPAIKRELKILRYSLVSNDNVKESLRSYESFMLFLSTVWTKEPKMAPK